MANTKTGKQRIKVNETKKHRNTTVKSSVKTAFKKAAAALEGKKEQEIASSVKDAIRKVDKAAAKGIVQKNTAARKKSRLMAQINKAGAAK